MVLQLVLLPKQGHQQRLHRLGLPRIAKRLRRIAKRLRRIAWRLRRIAWRLRRTAGARRLGSAQSQRTRRGRAGLLSTMAASAKQQIDATGQISAVDDDDEEEGGAQDARDSLEYTPLQLGCENGHAEAVGLLLAHGADPAPEAVDPPRPV